MRSPRKAATSSISASASPTSRRPSTSRRRAIKAIRDGHHGYTAANGIPQLREAVAADLHKRFTVTVSPDEVMIMPGGKPTMFMSILMFGEPGAEIMYPDPGFPIYRSMIEYTGAKPVPIPIREENGFAFSADETLKLITDKTRLHHHQLARQSDRRRHAEGRGRQVRRRAWRSGRTSP